jgi:hypothetical protein
VPLDQAQLVSQDHKVHKAHQDLLATQDHKDQQVPQALVQLVHKDHKDLQAIQVPQDLQEQAQATAL